MFINRKRYNCLLALYSCGTFVVQPTLIAQNFIGYTRQIQHDTVIPYTFITNTQRTIGVSADSQGLFFIPDISKFDSLRISSIGYKTITVPITQSGDTFFLEETPLLLTEVVVEKKSTKKEKLGVLNRKPNGSYGGALTANNEITLFIANKSKREGYIQQVAFFFTRDGKYASPFLLRIYENDNQKPGKEIGLKQIVLKGYKKGGWNKFKVKDALIPFPPNGCFISFQWLNINNSRYSLKGINDNEGMGQSIGLSTQFNESLCYLRQNEGEWESSKDLLVLKDTILMTEKYFNPMIAIEVAF